MKPFFKPISPPDSPQSDPFRGKGFALISTLLIIAVLTIMVVAFMQSMRIDRLTARSYLSKQQAEMAANAGVAYAQTYLLNLISTDTYYATGYTNVPVGQVSPVFMGATNATNTPTLRYLISTPNPLVAPVFDSTNSIDLNKMPGRIGGWLGSPMIAGNLVTTTNKAMWINILKDPSRPMQPNKSQPLYNPVVSRYAYWIEDETAKIDVGKVGNAGPTGAFQRSTNNFGVTNIDLGALPLSNKVPLAVNESVINKQMIDTRAATYYLPYDTGLINRLAYPGENNTNVWNDVRFHATPYSLSNELSAKARRRININAIVTNVAPGDTSGAGKVAADLDDIVFAISGKHPFTGLSNAADSGLFLDKTAEDGMLKDFGKRFYTSPSPMPNTGTLKANHEMTYLLRIAANIRDYIDNDNLPTFVDHQGNVSFGSAPMAAFRSGEEPVALGKEGLPNLQEHAWRALVTQYSPIANSTDSSIPKNRVRISFTLDHYFEFYNPTTTNFTAPAGTFLRVYNRPSFSAGTVLPSQIDPEDFTLDLSGASFPAGQAVVVTTSPSAAYDPPALIPGPNVVRPSVPASARVFTGIVANEIVAGRYGLQLIQQNTSSDYTTEMLFATPNGVVESHPFIAVTADFSFTRASEVNEVNRFIFATNISGNYNSAGAFVPSRTGDPRSINEPLSAKGGSNSAFGVDQARFFTSITGGGTGTIPVPGTSTFGLPAGSPQFVKPDKWLDYAPVLTNNSGTAYGVIRDQNMDSIGELGNIYDPHRKFSTETLATILSARGGARSLKIGQPDDLIGTARFSAASPVLVGWFNAAWRLTDIFYAGPSTEQMAPVTAEGKLNINGVLRDQGVAFKALLRAFTFLPSPDSDPVRAGQPLTEAEMNALIASITSYLRTNGPMMERGELSQIPFFADTSVAGTGSSATANDRGREELFRRILELITTRSACFTVYCIGEAVTQKSNGDIQRVAVSKERVSFTITPKVGDNLLDTATFYQLQNYAETSE